jgi:hypothetical protein
MSSIDAKLMCVIAAIRHGIQTTSSPGLSVNNHPNPFFLHVIGELDLKHIAERVLKNLEQAEALAQVVAQAKKEADAAAAAPVVSDT